MTAAFSSTEKIKRRYLLIEGHRDAIARALLDYTGILGWARAAPVFIRASSEKWVLAVDRGEIVHVRAAMAIAPEMLKVLRVSGTLKGLGVKIPHA